MPVGLSDTVQFFLSQSPRITLLEGGWDYLASVMQVYAQIYELEVDEATLMLSRLRQMMIRLVQSEEEEFPDAKTDKLKKKKLPQTQNASDVEMDNTYMEDAERLLRTLCDPKKFDKISSKNLVDPKTINLSPLDLDALSYA